MRYITMTTNRTSQTLPQESESAWEVPVEVFRKCTSQPLSGRHYRDPPYLPASVPYPPPYPHPHIHPISGDPHIHPHIHPHIQHPHIRHPHIHPHIHAWDMVDMVDMDPPISTPSYPPPYPYHGYAPPPHIPYPPPYPYVRDMLPPPPYPRFFLGGADMVDMGVGFFFPWGRGGGGYGGYGGRVFFFPGGGGGGPDMVDMVDMMDMVDMGVGFFSGGRRGGPL